MDPYLEERQLWPDVHLSLITSIRDTLAPQVAPAYYVRIEQRTYSVEVSPDDRFFRPDAAVVAVTGKAPRSGGTAVATPAAGAPETVLLPRFEEIREGYLEIRDTRSHQVVTAIEILSPTNKAAGEGRMEYERKRNRVLKSQTNLVEIDLLRGGVPMAMEPVPQSDYRIVVSAAWERPTGRLFRFSLRDPIPEVPVPLREGEQEARLSLAALLTEIYDRARYDLSVDYHQPPPEPSLSREDDIWVDELLRARGLQA
jgi:hypothetical protein